MSPEISACIAILPFAFPNWRDDQEGVLACQGLATFIETRLRAIPRSRVYVQHLMMAPGNEKKGPNFVVRSSMWNIEEALELPAPEGSRPTHLLQGCLRLGPKIDLALEVIDTAAAYVSFQQKIESPPGIFLERFFGTLGALAEVVRPGLPISQRLLIARQPTNSFEAFRYYLIGLARRIQRQVGELPATVSAAFDPFLKALQEDRQFVEPCVAIELLAQEMLQQNQNSEAIMAVLREAQQLAPQFAGFRAVMGIHLFDEGRLDEARRFLEEYLQMGQERGPSVAAAYVRLAAIYHQTRQTSRAEDLLRTALKKFPENPDVRESLGVCLAESGNLGEAEECWRKVLESHPTRTTSLSNLAMICWRKGESERAEILFERSIDAPDSNELAYSRYLEYLMEKDGGAGRSLDRADEVATERIERFPGNWRSWVQLGHIRRRLGQISAAEYCLTQAEKRVPADVVDDDIAIARFALHQAGEFPLYIAAVHTTTWTRPGAPTTEEEKRDCLTSSVSLLRGLTDRNPDYPFLWKIQADRLAQLGQYESAVAAQERYLRLVPNSSAGHNLMAGLLLKAGRRGDAIKAFRLAVDHAADPTVYRTNLATILIEAGELDAAGEQLEAARAEKPSDFVVAVLAEKLAEKRAEIESRKAPLGVLRRLLGLLGF